MPGLLIPLYGAKGYGKVTQTAGTVITRLIEPGEMIGAGGAYTRIADVWYTAAGTAHTLTVLRPLGKTTVSSAAAAAQAVINITADPGKYDTYGVISVANNLIAGSDFCVYRCADGTYVLDTVSSVSTLAITMTGNVPTAGVLAGSPFWWFGIITDINPADNKAHPQFTLPASVSTYIGNDIGDGIAGFISSIAPGPAMKTLAPTWPLSGTNEPLILHSGNATAQGTLEKAAALYSDR